LRVAPAIRSPMFGLFKKPGSEDKPAPADAPSAGGERPLAGEAHPPGGGWFGRLKSGLKRTGSQITGLLVAKRIDEKLFEDLESALIQADAGLAATAHLIQALRRRAREDRLETADQLRVALQEELTSLLAPLQQPLDTRAAKPFVIIIAGVNGTGKTTSIGKLAKFFGDEGKSVLLAAGDTFRAAAREQLVAWGERNGVTVIAQDRADPASVVFDAIAAARARDIDVVIADTAGRLPTQLHLMEEIKKVKRVIGKAMDGAPHEVMIVLDANTGQNALNQVKAFDDALGVTGIVMTKLDGTARGGVVAAIAYTRSVARGTPIPLRFVGVGESLEDLRPFVAADFARALLE
jgi:fused signal recognition particle receptor